MNRHVISSYRTKHLDTLRRFLLQIIDGAVKSPLLSVHNGRSPNMRPSVSRFRWKSEVKLLQHSLALSRLESPHIGQRGAARERGQPAQPRVPNRVSVRAALVRLLVQGRRRRQLLQQGRRKHKVRVSCPEGKLVR